MWGDISLWFWFAFLQQLAMWNIFSRASWPSICLLQRNVYLGLLSILWLTCLFLCCYFFRCYYLAQCPFSTGFPGSSAGKPPTCSAGDLGSLPGWEDLLEKGKATHSSVLTWRISVNVIWNWCTIPWIEQPLYLYLLLTKFLRGLGDACFLCHQQTWRKTLRKTFKSCFNFWQKFSHLCF